MRSSFVEISEGDEPATVAKNCRGFLLFPRLYAFNGLNAHADVTGKGLCVDGVFTLSKRTVDACPFCSLFGQFAVTRLFVCFAVVQQFVDSEYCSFRQ